MCTTPKIGYKNGENVFTTRFFHCYINFTLIAPDTFRIILPAGVKARFVYAGEERMLESGEHCISVKR